MSDVTLLIADPRIVCCAACDGEGRDYHGPCRYCDGTGGEIITTHPIEMEDLGLEAIR